MNKLLLEKDVIIKRVEGIEGELSELKKIGEKPFDEFESGDGWKLAQFHLHRALEGVFNIGAHILSRMPGNQATQYKEIAIKLGEKGIIDKKYAESKLAEMAKYRNRLVHFYAQIKPPELYKIIREDTSDFDVFLSSIKKVLLDPQKFGLATE